MKGVATCLLAGGRQIFRYFWQMEGSSPLAMLGAKTGGHLCMSERIWMQHLSPHTVGQCAVSGASLFLAREPDAKWPTPDKRRLASFSTHMCVLARLASPSQAKA